MSDAAKRSAGILIAKALDDSRPDGMALYTPELAAALLDESDTREPCPDNSHTLMFSGVRDGKRWCVRLAGFGW